MPVALLPLDDTKILLICPPGQQSPDCLVACLMGFLGGLVASAIKRDQGVKDWGHLIEGHGGMMDRADSLVFAAPVFFHTVRYFWSA
jgi:phosphatidate cytidylyltransferase